MKLTQFIIVLSLLFPFLIIAQDNPLEGQKLKELEIEIIYDQGTEMTVESKFKIIATVTFENGKKHVDNSPIDYKSSFKVKTEGAKYNAFKQRYIPNLYCEDYNNKELIISVSAEGTNTITKTVKFIMNCTQSPESIARKKKEDEEELKRLAIENAEAKVAKEKLDIELAKIEKLASEGKVVGITSPINSMSVTEFINPEFRHFNTVKIDNEFLFLGAVAINDGSKKTVPAIYKLKNNKLIPLTVDIVDFPILDNTGIRDLIKISETEVVVSTDNGLIKMKKTPTGYKNILHINSSADYPLSFPRIVNLGNDKCVSIGYPRDIYAGDINYIKNREKGYHNSSYIYPDTKLDTSAYMIIWDYNTNKNAYMLMGENISEECIIAADNNGDIICSMGGHSRQHPSKPSTPYCYKPLENVICSIDTDKSFENNSIWYNWTKSIHDTDSRGIELSFTVTDIIVEENNDIVFSAISYYDEVYQVWINGYDKSRLKLYSNIGVGRLSPQGNVKNWNFDDGINLSLWGGSSNGDLQLQDNPGKIYYSSHFPKLLECPDGSGYILVSSCEYDKLTFPEGYYKTGKTTISSEEPLLVFLTKKDLFSASFDIALNKNLRSHKDHFLFYNSSSKKYSYIKTRHAEYESSILLDFELNINKNWHRKPGVIEYKAGTDEYVIYRRKLNEGNEIAADNSPTNDTQASSSNSNTRSNSNSSSSSSEPEVKLVQVYVDPNGKGTVKIYWKQDGSSKKFTLTGSRRAIGYIPEGTELSYSVGPDHNKKNYFYTVPSGKSSVSVDL